MKLDPTTHKPITPGRSVYLSNAQWEAMNEFLEMETLWNDFEQSGSPEQLKSAFEKLLKVSREVCG